MSMFLTLVSGSDEFQSGLVSAVEILLEENGLLDTNGAKTLAENKATDFHLQKEPSIEIKKELRRLTDMGKADLFFTPAQNRRKKLLIADMDSTIVAEETLDELAKHYGVGKMVSEITERAMRGEIDFKTSLRERVALLSGKDSAVLSFVRDDMTLNKGAKTIVQTMAKHDAKCILISGGFTIVQTMAKHDAKCILISGGFTFFTKHIANICGFDHHHGNTLQVKNSKLSGFVDDPILDSSAKSEFMREYMSKYRVKSDDVLAIGDGANDKNMITDAGLGIGYYPKDVLETATDNHIFYGDLTSALYAQGYHKDDFHVE